MVLVVDRRKKKEPEVKRGKKRFANDTKKERKKWKKLRIIKANFALPNALYIKNTVYRDTMNKRRGGKQQKGER